MMTNLNMETAEELQIANYGIGGHYDPHFDHARKEESKSFDTLGTGNRIATVLFYMTQPVHGGGTVFTDVKSTILPSKIANYGIGGHYDPHFDHARKEESKSFDTLGTGNRIATVLFYMTQPVHGGGTVFTDVKSTILPSKNDALFWYNLHKFGDGDTRTRHAACPVLVGIKWVSNKWIHERGNEFRRPCGLKISDYERFAGDLGFGPEPRVAPNLSPDLSKDIFNTI
ncbi:oxidoreductase, 2OG-Fe(II) oxygenase family protein [Dictyocaulus viviparus]|uniref:Oxidoreductase, 2OG-Fe(II) oxygenase family protein n=1 Tax=Dictyocaulus viviparus TaxID=29172 RepID=A0A0D8XLP3_DICVI|nr:oxidoreductase, 2OG-Fe(II) oxygenase family protein [Dictyocaulus viviparus]